MKQIWNIFRKDLRRFWRESAVSLALLTAYAWNDVQGWSGERNLLASGLGRLFTYQFLSGLVDVLLPLAWSFLIVRVVQGEALVGDRQFWITRPYEWKKLLAAKALFVVLTINVPLLMMDFFLLAKAGFPPGRYVGGLLWMQLLISLILIMPVATLATVTVSVVQFILAALGVVLFIIGVTALASVIPSSSFSDPADLLELVLLIATCGAVILGQYARRKTAGSRWLIVGLALTTVVFVAAAPYNAIVNRQFPRLRPGEPLPVQLALLPAHASGLVGVSDQKKEIVILIPFETSGIANDAIVVVSGVNVFLKATDGLRWNSGWQSPGIQLFPDQKRMQISFTLKKNLFEQLKSHPVQARISLALTIYRDKNRREFVTPGGEFLMPDVGLCSAETLYRGGMHEMHCRVPLRTPSSILITSDLSATTCPAMGEEKRAEAPEIARNWHEHSDSGPAELGISPVKTLDLFLWPQHESARQTISGICPGTPLVISSPELDRRTGTDLEINSLHLADYLEVSPEFSRFGIVVRQR